MSKVPEIVTLNRHQTEKTPASRAAKIVGSEKENERRRTLLNANASTPKAATMILVFRASGRKGKENGNRKKLVVRTRMHLRKSLNIS